jgi:hypothetical protein
MKKLKTEKAFLGKLFKEKGSSSSDGGGGGAFGMFNFADLFRRAGAIGNNVVGGDSSAWSKEKMAGLSKQASASSGKQTEQQTAKASKGKFIIGKGSDYIKDLL